MTWNKCTEKLPEVGMLVISRYAFPKEVFYDVGIVKESKKDYFIVLNKEEFIELGSKYTEWKEVEKD